MIIESIMPLIKFSQNSKQDYKYTKEKEDLYGKESKSSSQIKSDFQLDVSVRTIQLDQVQVFSIINFLKNHC